MDEDDRDSNAFSENDQDEVMEDVAEPEVDPEPGNDAEEDDEEADDDDDGEPEAVADARRGREPSGALRTTGPGPDRTDSGDGSVPDHKTNMSGNAVADGTAVDSAETMAATASVPPLVDAMRLRIRPEALAARIYDIVPTMAAPQATSINALAVTPDLRYWMTGGSDGYIRKYDGPGTINGRQLLTVAQRHPFVDSVVKAGILMSYWENEEPPSASARGADEHMLSPVYSLAVHSRALWLLAGTEGGGINLQSVRHDEGKRITCLQRHTNAVSVLQLAPDEKSVLSGSWDKTILDWDLNDGQIRRQYDGSSGQISAIELRPASGAPIPAQGSDEEHVKDADLTLTSSNNKPLPNGVAIGGPATGMNAVAGGDVSASGASANISGDEPLPDHESLFGSPGGSLFGGSDAMGANPFGDDDMGIAPGSATIGDEDAGDFSQDVAMALDTGGPAVDSIAVPGTVSAPSSPKDGSETKATAAGDESMTEAGPSASKSALPADDSERSAEKQAAGADVASAPAHTATPVPETIVGDTGAASSNKSSLSQQQQQQQLDQELQQSAETQLREASDAQANTTGVGGDPTTRQIASPGHQETHGPSAAVYTSQGAPPHFDPSQVSDNTFFSASIDGPIRIWDRRQKHPVARIGNRPGVPPWCMGACWSPDGNRIYAGRRNGTVEEFDIHKAKAGWQPERALRFPAGSGPFFANYAHDSASHDILRLYDIQDSSALPHSHVPFLIIPGPPRAGVISHLYIDQTSRFMISTAGTRGWEGTSTEALIGYEINSIVK
ncbi:transcriptional activator SPT8 [Sporothrix schenckii 1099-18]|uniref:Mitochondrial division protein 1 n=1 Tax=Sporothrix schenckii 1099-18 TaxID=1397361 RepID=A0A0F2M2H4_SPOSC|nr:transcriptional activator SPT8 [Sporothrix schenckii 1099-18]KJR83304.1 transcriptional activator SPT8 [Sporothrix schenckii 1099-18]